MRTWIRPLTGLLVLAAGLTSLPAAAQTDTSAPPAAPAEPAAPEGEKKPLAGKGGFSLEQYEASLFDDRAKEIQARMSEIRKRKIETLESIINSPRPYQNKADVLFRLAEAYWEEAKYQYLLAREKYEKELECYEDKRCTDEPVEPQENYETALGYYRQILREHPSYERIDEVYYYLGRAALMAGKTRKDSQLQKEGVSRLNDLVQKYPKSRFVAQSHLALGEYFFETDSLFYAKTNYEKIIQNFPDSTMFNYALYKLGWVYFNLTEYEKTIETFQKVVANIGGEGAGSRIEFREQALNDLVVAWAEIDNGWQDARRYFLKEVGEEKTYEKLERMAGLLVSKDKDEEAIALYQHLIEHDKTSPKVVEYYDALLEIDRKLADVPETERTINEIVGFFDHKGAWWLANKDKTEVANRADDLVATNLLALGTNYHRAAQKLDEQRKNADTEYAAAAKYYKMFLDRFPDHEKSYLINFYYAEILYEKNPKEDPAQWEMAAQQYEKVLEKDKKGEFVEDAALGIIYAIEKLMVSEGLRDKISKDVEYVAEEKKADLKDEELKPIPRTDLHPLEKRYVNAADAYVDVLSSALKDEEFRKKYPDRGEMIPEIMFIAAQTFYKHGQFAEAVNRLMVIFDLYPSHKMANIAVNTIIDAYARLKHWEKIEEWARKLIKSGNFQVKSRAELEQMIAIAKTEHARDLTKQRRFDEAINVQQEIVDEFGKKNKELASTALYNIGVIHESARRFPEAVETYEEVIKRYPKEDVAVQAQFNIAVLYESQTEFEKAAQAFIKMERFKTHEKAGDAVRNAGLIYEALEQYSNAHDTFERYLKLFPSKEDAPTVAFHSAEVLEKEDDPKAMLDAAKSFERIARTYGRKDAQLELRATAAAAAAYKKADKVKNRRVAEKLFQSTLTQWNKLNADGTAKVEPSTKAYAGMAALELAEYAYDDYADLKIEAVHPRFGFSINILKKTLTAKAEALGKAEKAFDAVLAFQDPGMAAAAAFREGQLLYEFAESLFNADVPPGLTPDQVDEYRYQLEEVAAPIQEKALIAFTLALRNALDKGVYNKWSRLSAEYAAKVNPDEFPISSFALKPDKTKDTLSSTSFIKIVSRGDAVVDFSGTTDDKTETPVGEAP
ncbi:MAG: tetratricopeptide repeat protein [Deltaproteobacteria bacterium]|nr:tetratricopeptide repeat protein [Deltaproteobacteria bacterium]MCB9785855.1 tetratricopeptide repeat protein [Deltaproteobacteria bacterium]